MTRPIQPHGYRWIAVRELTAVVPDEGIVPVRLKLGLPVLVDGWDTVCWVQWDGLDESPRFIVGVDAWQALTLAVCFLRSRADCYDRQGITFHLPVSADVLSVDDLFSHLRRHDPVA